MTATRFRPCRSRLMPALAGLALAATAVLGPGPARAALIQTTDETDAPAMTRRTEPQIDAGAIALPTGDRAGASSEIWSDFGEERWVRNVNQPTLLPLLPDPAIANGRSVLLIPGGGFQFVSIDNEGYRIAEPLVEQGYTVFLLKYRTMTTPESESAFSAHMGALFSGELPFADFDRARGEALAIADAQTAWQMIQDRAGHWGIDPDQTGILGFSAGAITALGLARHPGDVSPAFLGYIYGPMTVEDLPSSPPPLFSALAADDSLFAGQGFQLIEAWQAAGAPVEFHYYASGGHGFGSYRRGTPADDWLEHFTTWLDTRPQ